jgi:hypothetical protein
MSWQPGRDGILGVLERANSRGWSSTPDWRCGTATHPIATPCLVTHHARMRFSINIPNFADARTVATVAEVAEQAGWTRFSSRIT